MKLTDTIRSITDTCEIDVVASPRVDRGTPPGLLIEIPHGATRRAHFEAIRRRLTGKLPADLEAFFFVNTDVGAPECAREIARQLTGPRAASKVLIVRSLVPRTFIDCNRVVEADGAPGRSRMTPAIASYVASARDAQTLRGLHRTYQEVAESAYELVCGAGGTALMLHTYAPRTVEIDEIDEHVVERLRRAYEPEVWRTWEARPDVDVITEATDGRRLASPELVNEVKREYAAIGLRVTENASYRLDPATVGYVHAARYPGRTLCIEINRALLADPFSPFEEMRIGLDKVAAMATPLASALGDIPLLP